MISILLPSRGRPAQLHTCVERLFDTVSEHEIDVECIVVLDKGDTESVRALSGLPVKIHKMNLDFTNAPDKYNAGLSIARGEWIVTGSDDVYWHDNWLDCALDTDNDGIVGFWDGHTSPNDWATHGIVKREIIDKHFAGYISFPWYRSWYADREGKARIERAGLRYIVAMDAIVEHNHPDWGKAKMDATYEAGFRWHAIDRQTFDRHAAAGFPDGYLQTVSIIMPAKIKDEQDMAWLREAVDSVLAQEMCDWQLVIINDHSTRELIDEWSNDSRIRIYNLAGKGGVSIARNTAAHVADSELLFPMDADDKLTPDALMKLLAAWNSGGSAKGFVYPSVIAFGQDFEKKYPAQSYSFDDILKREIMVCGLHRKSDWARSGGWKSEMDAGLEDWEYWITLGELGVCGMPIPDYIYHYRRKANGRLAALKMQEQKARIVALHKDAYEGRYPMACCGGKGRVVVTDNRRSLSSDYVTPDNITLIQYTGRRAGSFGVRGNISGIRYTVPGIAQLVMQPNGAPGADSRDVPWLLSLGRGADFAIYTPPQPAQPAIVQMQPAAIESIDEVINATVERIAAVVAPDSDGIGDMATVKPVRIRGRTRRHVSVDS